MQKQAVERRKKMELREEDEREQWGEWSNERILKQKLKNDALFPIRCSNEN